MSPPLVLAALALACLGVAAEPDCNTLVQPLVNRTSILGKWIIHAATTDKEASMAYLRMFTSSWFHTKRTIDGTLEKIEFVNKVDGKCLYFESNITTVGDRTVMEYTYAKSTFVRDVQRLETCPDCLLWSDTARSPDFEDTRHLFIFTRTGNLSLPHLEVFKQQAACLNFTLGLHMGSDTDLTPWVSDLCPEKNEENEDE